MTAESGYVKNGAARIYYEVAGAGTPPLVFMHAGVCDRRQWDNEFAHFARDHRVLRYDMRGYGKSEPVEGEFRHIDDMRAVLDYVSLEEPLVLIGCSMSGGRAIDFALAHPDRVRGIVMVCSAPSGLRFDFPDPPIEVEAEAAIEAREWDRAAELSTQAFFDGMGRTPQQVNQPMRRLALEMVRLAFTHQATGLGKQLRDAETPAAPRLSELRAPVLVIVGENDIPYIHAAGDHMAKEIPHARKVLMTDAAHMPNMDHPEEFERIVRSFLAEIR